MCFRVEQVPHKIFAIIPPIVYFYMLGSSVQQYRGNDVILVILTSCVTARPNGAVNLLYIYLHARLAPPMQYIIAVTCKRTGSIVLLVPFKSKEVWYVYR